MAPHVQHDGERRPTSAGDTDLQSGEGGAGDKCQQTAAGGDPVRGNDSASPQPNAGRETGVVDTILKTRTADHIHVSYQTRQWTTVTAFTSLVILPLAVNTIWLATGNSIGCGSAGQDFWWFTLYYDMYFMLAKSTMISMYFYVFMPDVVSRTRAAVFTSHGLFAVLSVAIGISMNMLWYYLGHYDVGRSGWHFHKLNLPTSLLCGSFLWGMPHVLIMWTDWKAWQLAMKRCLLLCFVIVGDLMFIASSLAYVWLVFFMKKNPLGLTWWGAQTAIQLALTVGFGSVYMPILGKIWWIAILLIDKFAPMDDLMRQRLFHFATVILDMHRIMYARQIFSSLSEFWIFFLVVTKDLGYDLYQFGVKSDEAYIATVLHLYSPGGMQIIPGWRVWLFKLVEIWARLLGPSKSMMVAFHLHINAGPSKDANAGDNSSATSNRPVRFYFCDHLLHIHNLANSFTIAPPGRKEAGDGEDTTGDAAGDQKSPEENSVAQVHKLVADGLMEGGDVPSQGAGRIMANPRLQHGDSHLDVERAASMVAHGDTLSLSEGHVEASRNFLGIEEWRILFLKHVILRIQGLMCLRYRTRLLVRYLSALNFCLTQYFIRSSPSRHVMNVILDNTTEMSNDLWLKGFVFLAADLFAGFVITAFHSRNPLARQFGDWRYRKIYGSLAFAIMITICTVCCNTDIYLTFPELKFCDM